LKRFSRTAVAASLVFAVARSAHAQGGSADAEELFKQGRAALEVKDFRTACARFAASLALERAVGTLISLGQCEEATDQLASAMQHWLEAADLADATHDRLNRGPVARRKVSELAPKVPRLRVRLLPGAPANTVIRRDDIELGAGALDVSFPVDAGARVVVVTAPGRVAKTYSVSLAPGESVVLEVEPGAPLPTPGSRAPMAPPGPAAAQDRRAALDPVAPAHAKPLSGAPSLGMAYVAGSIAIVGLGLGSIFGVEAITKWVSAKNDCGSGCVAGSLPRTEKTDATTDATVADVAFAVAGVALVGAVVSLIAARKTPTALREGKIEVSPSFASRGLGVAAAASF
jgi:hypothetical protein